jgi:dipeptidyl aminopeptidase/acylaminoacyl peptidase
VAETGRSQTSPQRFAGIRDCVRVLPAFWVALLCVCPSSLHAAADPGLTFDPTPLQLPQATKGERRAPVAADLIQLRDLRGIQMSPDGEWIAFVVSQTNILSKSYRTGLFIVRRDGSGLLNLGTAGLAHWDFINQWLSDPPLWSPDSKSLFYRYKDDRIWEVWKWSLSTGPPSQITHTADPVSSFSIAPTGSSLVLTLDVRDRLPIAVQDGGILYDGTLTGWHGRPISEEFQMANHHKETWIHDLSSGTEHQASEGEVKQLGLVNPSLPHVPASGEMLRSKLSPDGKYVAYQLYVDHPGTSTFSEYPIFVRALNGPDRGIEVSSKHYRTLDEYWWHHDSRTLYYVDRETGNPPTLMSVGRDGEHRTQILTTQDFLDQFSFDNSGRYIAMSRQTSVVPPEVTLGDAATGAVSVLVNLNPELDSIDFGPAQRIEFSARSGEKFHGHLILPVGYERTKRYPLIITGYSDTGEFLRGGTGDEYPIQLFAANGFVVLNFSVAHNGLTIKPGDFQTAILRLEAPLEGMAAAIKYLDAHGIIDPSRVGITGLSHGAEVLCYAISHSDLFKAAIASGPPGDDPYFFYMAGSAWHEIFAKWGLGGWPEGASRTNWHKIAAMLNADRIDSPLLINAADSEYLVGLGLVTSLEQLRKPVEMFIYPNELHFKIQPKHRQEIYERNVDWFRFWLRNEQDPAPSKTEEYKRWHDLRLKYEHDRARPPG